MRKTVPALLALVMGFCFVASAHAELGWSRSTPLKIQTNKAASTNQADNDSFTVSLGAANTSDTTYAFGPVFPLNAPDSMQFVLVSVQFASAIASGESVYTVLQGSADGGQSWTHLNVGGISIGGSLTGQVASGVVRLSSALTSATNVAAKSPVGPGFFYSQWFGWPMLRLIIISDKSAAMAANNTYKVSVVFPTNR